MGSDSSMSMMMGASRFSGIRLVPSSTTFILRAPLEFSRASWHREVSACWTGVSWKWAKEFRASFFVNNVKTFIVSVLRVYLVNCKHHLFISGKEQILKNKRKIKKYNWLIIKSRLPSHWWKARRCTAPVWEVTGSVVFSEPERPSFHATPLLRTGT